MNKHESIFKTEMNTIERQKKEDLEINNDLIN